MEWIIKVPFTFCICLPIKHFPDVVNLSSDQRMFFNKLQAGWLMECFLLAGSAISTKDFLNSVRVTSGFLVTSLTNALLDCYSFWQDSMKSPGGPNFFHCINMKSTVLLGILNTLEILLHPYSDLCNLCNSNHPPVVNQEVKDVGQ